MLLSYTILCLYLLIQHVYTWSLIQPTTTGMSPRRGHTAIQYNDTTMIVFGGRQLQNTIVGTVPSTNLTQNILFNVNLNNNLTDTIINICNNWLYQCNNNGVCTYTVVNNSTSITAVNTVYSITDVLTTDLTQYTGQNITASCSCNSGYTDTICQTHVTDNFYNDIGFYNIVQQTWSIVQADPAGTVNPVAWPEPRYEHTSVLINNTMIVYGGYSQYCADYCQPVWEYNMNVADTQGRGIWTTYDFTNATVSPGARWLHMSILYNNVMYIYGGFQVDPVLGSIFLNDMYKYSILNNGTRQWIQILNTTYSTNVPCVRTSAGSALYNNEWYIFGGFTVPLNRSTSYNIMSTTSSYFLKDLWKFNLITLEWSQVIQPSDALQSPPAMYGCKMQFTVDGILMLFGGYSNNLYHNEIWRFNTSTSYWTQQTITYTNSLTIPTQRSDHTWLYYSTINNGIFILFAGYGFDTVSTSQSTIVSNITLSETYYSDLWEFQLNACPGNCNGRGVCSYGYCYCNDGYYGSDCQQNLCVGDQCTYDNQTQVSQCTHCNSNGLCLYGTCVCAQYYIGNACQQPTCLNNCTDATHGTCVVDTTTNTAACQCNNNWSGEDCSVTFCVTNCNAPVGGYCDTSTGNCVCYSSLVGSYVGTGCATYLSKT